MKREREREVSICEINSARWSKPGLFGRENQLERDKVILEREQERKRERQREYYQKEKL